MRRYKKEMFIEGVYHPIAVRVVSQSWINKYAKGKKDSYILGTYNDADMVIYLSNRLSPHVMEHTLDHEMAHHLDVVWEEMADEEDHCDIIGSFLKKNREDREKILKFCQEHGKKSK